MALLDVQDIYTYYGDALLTGSITAADYIQIDSGFTSNGALTGWFNGDFNYDNKINGERCGGGTVVRVKCVSCGEDIDTHEYSRRE